MRGKSSSKRHSPPESVALTNPSEMMRSRRGKNAIERGVLVKRIVPYETEWAREVTTPGHMPHEGKRAGFSHPLDKSIHQIVDRYLVRLTQHFVKRIVQR